MLNAFIIHFLGEEGIENKSNQKISKFQMLSTASVVFNNDKLILYAVGRINLRWAGFYLILNLSVSFCFFFVLNQRKAFKRSEMNTSPLPSRPLIIFNFFTKFLIFFLQFLSCIKIVCIAVLRNGIDMPISMLQSPTLKCVCLR